jgi:hypothetical protein
MGNNGTHHQERKHSKFSASGAERWFNCSGSVALSEGMPDKDSIWSKEGTTAHELLEEILSIAIELKLRKVGHINTDKKHSMEMRRHCLNAANFVLEKHWHMRHYADLLIEDRVYLDFIHPEMFGTYDIAIVEHFGTLHVFDYKYGAGHPVNPKENLQMIFYGIGLAHKFHWNFSRVRLWINQPRIRGYDGPVFWELTLDELKAYVPKFEAAVERVEKYPDKYAEGSWCHWCKAKSKCPLKLKGKLETAKSVFLPVKK